MIITPLVDVYEYTKSGFEINTVSDFKIEEKFQCIHINLIDSVSSVTIFH